MVAGSESDGASPRFRRKGSQLSLAIVEAEDGSGDFVGLVGAIRQRSPGTHIVLVGDFRHPNWLQHSLAWVDGVVQEDARPEVLIASLDLIMSGAGVLPSALTRLLIEQARTDTGQGHLRRLGFDDQRFVDLRIRRLSILERAVLECLMTGATNKTIARQLNLTVAAINIAMKGIFRKIDARNRTQAALWALENLPNGRGPE